MPCGKTYTALVARAGTGRTQPDAAPRTTAVFRKGRKGMALTWVWVGMLGIKVGARHPHVSYVVTLAMARGRVGVVRVKSCALKND